MMATLLTKRAAAATLTVILAVLLAVVLAGCAKKEKKAGAGGGPDGYEVPELRYQGWAGRVLYTELGEDLGYLAPLKLKWVGNTISGPQDIQAVATGNIDFGIAFTGSIVKLVSAAAPIKMVIAANGMDSKSWSGCYVLEDSPIRSGRDLIGKKVAINTLGAHAEFITREYLRRQGLSNDEIKQVSLVVVPPLNGEQALRQRQVDAAILNSVTKDKALERGGIRHLFTDFQLFGPFSYSGQVMTTKFIRENPKAAGKFVEATAKAIEWAQTHPREEVLARMEQIIKKRGRNENTEPLKYWQSTGIAGKGGLITEKEVQLWIDWLVKDGQVKEGALQHSDIYTNDFNPYLAKPEAAGVQLTGGR